MSVQGEQVHYEASVASFHYMGTGDVAKVTVQYTPPPPPSALHAVAYLLARGDVISNEVDLRAKGINAEAGTIEYTMYADEAGHLHPGNAEQLAKIGAVVLNLETPANFV